MTTLSKSEQLVGIQSIIHAINPELVISSTIYSACVMVWNQAEAQAMERALWSAGHTNTFMRRGQYIDAWFLIVFYS